MSLEKCLDTSNIRSRVVLHGYLQHKQTVSLILVLVVLGAGTGIGAWASTLFIPYMQVGSEPSAGIPPFMVELAWPTIYRMYVLYGLFFGGGAIAVTGLLLRTRAFEAIKLGDTT